MPDYRQSSVSGTVWTRSHQVVINNRLNEIPSITFYEERRALLSDGSNVVVGGSPNGLPLQDMMSDANKEFKLLDPNTDQELGTAKYQDIYVILYSLYRDLANKRDGATV